MNKVKTTAIRLQNNIMMRMAGVSNAKEQGDHLLQVLGTIIIAVVILIFFRKELISLFQGAVTNTTTSVNGLFTNVTAPTS